MYVVRRAFRNYGKMMAPGSIVEPGAVKRFKSRLSDGHIVEVSEQDFDKWAEYFKMRLGITLVMPEPIEEPEQSEETEETEETVQPVQVAKVVVTAK